MTWWMQEFYTFFKLHLAFPPLFCSFLGFFLLFCQSWFVLSRQLIWNPAALNFWQKNLSLSLYAYGELVLQWGLNDWHVSFQFSSLLMNDAHQTQLWSALGILRSSVCILISFYCLNLPAALKTIGDSWSYRVRGGLRLPGDSGFKTNWATKLNRIYQSDRAVLDWRV